MQQKSCIIRDTLRPCVMFSQHDHDHFWRHCHLISALAGSMATASICREATNVLVTLASIRWWENCWPQNMRKNCHVVDCIILKESGECEDIDECSSSPCIGGQFPFVCSNRSSLLSDAPLVVVHYWSRSGKFLRCSLSPHASNYILVYLPWSK